MNWSHVDGAGLLGGIGFTMSIFITLLAFEEGMLVTQSKVAILVSSVVAGVSGFMYLNVKKQERKIKRQTSIQNLIMHLQLAHS